MTGTATLARFGLWEILLAVAVSAQAIVLAYLHSPEWKAFVYALPIPFTLSSLAIGRPIGATNVLALVLLIGFTQGVRLLHRRLRVPIVVAIILGTAGYSAAGWSMARVVPETGLVFWFSCAGVFLLAVVLLRLLPPRVESGHTSPLPIWIKLPLTVAVVLVLMTVKDTLKGFATVFPMVGVFAAYEARHSLWTLARQVPIFIQTILPMMIVCRLTQEHIGLGPSLILGWSVFLVLLLVRYRVVKRRAGGHGPPGVPEADRPDLE